MPRLATMISAAVLLCGLAPAAQARVQVIIVRWGEVEVEQGDPVPPAETGNYIGQSTYARAVHFLNWSDTVPAQRCRGFSVQAWLIAGPGESLPDHIELRMRHPRLTRPDGVSQTEHTAPVAVVGGETETSFTFDEPWEAQPGPWTMEFMIGGLPVASKTFTVTPVPPGQPTSVCKDIPQS